MADRPLVSDPPMARHFAAPAYAHPRRRWGWLVIPLLLVVIGVVVWRTDPRVWNQLRTAALSAIHGSGDANKSDEAAHYAPIAEAPFAGKGEVDVDGGLVKLFPAAYGEIDAIPVHENEHVAAGAVLLRLRDRAATLQVEEAKQGVELAGIELDKAKRAPDDMAKQMQMAEIAVQGEEKLLAISQRNLEHLRTLSSEVVSQESIRSANDAVAVAQQRVDAKRLERDRLRLRRPQDDVLTAQAALDRAKTKLAEATEEAERYVLKARSSGRIIRVNVNVGESFGPASREPAFLFCPDKPWIVRCEIEQEFASQVRVGTAVEIRDDATGQKIGGGVVERIAGVFTPRRESVDEARVHNDLRVMECIVLIKTGSETFRIGQTVRAIFRPAAMQSASAASAPPSR